MTSKQKETTDKWQRIVKEFEASGQTLQVFCEQHGISRYALRYWRSRRIPALRRVASVGMVEVKASAIPVSRAPSGNIRIIFPSGIIVEPVADWNQDELTRTLAAVRSL